MVITEVFIRPKENEVFRKPICQIDKIDNKIIIIRLFSSLVAQLRC